MSQSLFVTPNCLEVSLAIPRLSEYINTFSVGSCGVVLRIDEEDRDIIASILPEITDLYLECRPSENGLKTVDMVHKNNRSSATLRGSEKLFGSTDVWIKWSILTDSLI